MAEEKAPTNTSQSINVTLKKVRLSFPDLWKPRPPTPGAEPKYSAHFLIYKEPQADQIKALRDAVMQVAHARWGEKLPKGIKYCVHEGSEKEYEGYDETNVYITASSTRPPAVLDWDKTPLPEPFKRPYAGCYVVAKVRLWPQDNKFGKRINAELQGVQFASHGKSWGPKAVTADDFEELPPPEGVEPEESNGGGEPDPNEDDIPF